MRLNEAVVSETVKDENLDRLVSIPEDDMVTEIFDDVGEALIFLECAHKNLTNVLKKVMLRDNIMIYVRDKEKKMCELMKAVRKNLKLEEIRELHIVIRCEK